MYLEQAITRINNIDWDKVGTNPLRENGDLGATFLYRLAGFYSETLLKPYPPPVSDIAMLMGDRGEINFDEYYNDKTKKFPCQSQYQRKEFINRESCGCHGDDMKSILIFQAVNRNGKMVRIGGNICEVRLCRKCRLEMSTL